jgi:prepilin-type processing-associated H-X9-DG protein
MRENGGWGWIGLLLWFLGIMLFIVIAAAILFPVFVRDGHPSPKTSCLNNLKQLGTALNMYESDWDERLPPLYTVRACAPQGKGWMDKLMVYARNKRISRCPESPDRLTYSFNRRLAGINYDKIAHPADTFSIFESVNALPESNNLNGGEVCHPTRDRIPLPGQYIMWPEDTPKLQRDWPTWARPNHEDITNVIFADGHAKGVPWSQGPRLSPK